jgi:hypothetical protein
MDSEPKVNIDAIPYPKGGLNPRAQALMDRGWMIYFTAKPRLSQQNL